MKQLLGITLTLSLLLTYAAYAATDNSLVLYLPLNEGKGETTEDLSGNGNNGTLKGSPKWVDGYDGSALQFSGEENGNYVEVPDNPLLNPKDEITCMAWVYFDGWEPTGGVISKYVGSGNQRSYDIHMHHTLELSFTASCSSNGAYQVGVSTTNADAPAGTLAEGRWQHIAMTFKSSEFLRIYLDGEMVADSDAAATDSLFDNNIPLMIGTDFQIGGAHSGQPREFTGIIDEVAIYSRALSDADIKQAMEGILAAVDSQGKLTVFWGNMRAF
jgi:hypothetical protein